MVFEGYLIKFMKNSNYILVSTGNHTDKVGYCAAANTLIWRNILYNLLCDVNVDGEATIHKTEGRSLILIINRINGL